MSATGMSAVQIADILGVSAATTARAVRAENLAKAGDLEALRRDLPQSRIIVELACKKYGLSLDEPAAKQAPKQDNTAQAFVAMLDAMHELSELVKANTKEISEIREALSRIHMVLQGARNEANANAAKMVEAVNINGDIATKEHQKQTDLLASIKINTKRKNQGGEYQ